LPPVYKIIEIILQEKAAETAKQNKEENRKKPKPEEQEGTPQHQHCPPAKHRGDKNPKYHEWQHKDVASTLAAHPPKTPKGKEVVRQTKCCIRT
jgi:hypothetical protein